MNQVPIDMNRPSPNLPPGMTRAEYERLVSRGEKQSWTPDDEKRLRDKVSRLK